MRQYPGIDYEQRPASYWDDQGVLSALLRNVKGRERREMIRVYWQQGRIEELSETFLQETLSEEDRDALGRIHPIFMGGEYLPDYQSGEVEIARVELQSTTRDVISIRARRKRWGIGYRIVDEYQSDFHIGRESSRRPLTLAELIRLIDGSAPPGLMPGLALCYNELNAEASYRESLRHFTGLSSEFYPQLGEHYGHVIDQWVREEP